MVNRNSEILVLTETVKCSVIEEGSITTPALTLYDIVRKISEGNEIELISNDGNKLSVRSGKSKFSLSCLPKDDFPKIDNIGLDNEFELKAEILKKIIDKTRFAISNEETRYYLNGIYFHIIKEDNQSILRSVATDGHRLAKYEINLPSEFNNIPGIIIPKKTINEIRKLIEENEDNIKISISESKIIFSINNIILTSKLIDGSFPDYEKVIPKNNDKDMTASTSILYEAIDRVSTVSSEKSRSIKLDILDNVASLSSNSAETGSGAEDIEIEYSGSKIEIGYNAKYLLEIINQIDGEKVNFKLFDSSSPSIIKDLNDESTLYILMPMRV